MRKSKLRDLLSLAARRCTAVRGPIQSDFDSGREMSQFIMQCRNSIEHGTLEVGQHQELWRIFTPDGDWDCVVGDAELGGEIFALVQEARSRAV